MTSELPLPAPPGGYESDRRRSGLPALASLAVLAGYLLVAIALTWHLWADPGSATVAGNPGDNDAFAWFLRYDATAVLHLRLPALVTGAMNAPVGINLMWNNALLLPGVVLAPVTALAGPQASLTVLLTVGFAGSAASLYFVLRRWGVSRVAAAAGGAVYGFSPALLHSAVGHYNLQFAVLPPLIIYFGLRLCAGTQRPVRAGVGLGLLITAQLFIGEELLVDTAMAAVVLVAVLAASRPRAVAARIVPAASGLAVAAGLTAAVAGWALWTQFAGPLTEHGSSFLPDFYKNDLAGFITPSSDQLFHSAASAAAAARYQGGVPEYLAYLGLPMIVVLALAAVLFWRHLAVRATAVTLVVLEVLSLGSHPLIGGTNYLGVALPWEPLAKLPVFVADLPDRLSIIADGAAAALLAFAIDLAIARFGRNLRAALPVAVIAAAALLPLVPLPLPETAATPLPPGWTAALSALTLQPGARVLVVPVPTALLTAPLRWQAVGGERISLIGGYFQGPAWNGQAYIGGDGMPALGTYLDGLYSGNAVTAAPPRTQAADEVRYWDPAFVVAVPGDRPALRRYLDELFGPPTLTEGSILAWRRPPAGWAGEATADTRAPAAP